MKKCIRCGASFLTHMKITLKDAYICGKCSKELGFDKDFFLASSQYTYDQIKDGREALVNRQIQERIDQADSDEAFKLGITVKQLRQLEAAGPTSMETKIFVMICALLRDEDRDPDLIDVALGDNGSLLLMVDGVIFIRYKADSGVKWIVFENESEEKIRISGAARLNSYAPRIAQAYDSATM